LPREARWGVIAGRFSIDTQGQLDDQRLAGLQSWVRQFDGMAAAQIAPASEDASFRRYFRVTTESDTLIAMDAPPALEDSAPFVTIATYLADCGLNAPRIVAADLELGYLLLSDLGDQQYLESLRAEPAAAGRLYRDAIEALLQMQSRGREFQSRLPPFDTDYMHSELALFRDWLCREKCGLSFSSDDDNDWRATCATLIENANGQPAVFVHRDFHSRNLMVTAQDNPGVLDFQDAMEGPLTYDLVSLLKDCYFKLPLDEVERLAMTFYAGLPQATQALLDPDEFRRAFDLMGVQRHLKASGIFARLDRRDGKPRYMADVPRTLSYIAEVAPRYRELEFLEDLLRERLLPQLAA
tara:strand:+ start:271 stop:1332 length:1062 start_codon:yes stop_codon:yes gene_type:complete